MNDVIQKGLDSFHEKDHLQIRDGLLYAKVQKNNYLCNYFNNFIKLFHRKRLFADFFFTKETHGNPINKMFHVNDYLLLGDKQK